MTADPELQALLDHYRAMPPVAAMDVAIASADADSLSLSAPLARHVNDKGCAFGGSLVSLMTLAGWGLVTLKARAAGVDADVFVADSQVDYLAPLFADLNAGARLAEGSDWDAFAAALRERGRAHVHVSAEVPLPDGGAACRCRARYVAIARR
ncbi:YiiD C-terminal domain-containing protein [Luteimonas dalianensis]|uniref:YiiD C-terminal domain-containing protein n=1 Tax=Luteimonas dalianensis TaxID=1148196 RepID=UPI003BF3A0CB